MAIMPQEGVEGGLLKVGGVELELEPEDCCLVPHGVRCPDYAGGVRETNTWHVGGNVVL
jgi:hypothetical protein